MSLNHVHEFLNQIPIVWSRKSRFFFATEKQNPICESEKGNDFNRMNKSSFGQY